MMSDKVTGIVAYKRSRKPGLARYTPRNAKVKGAAGSVYQDNHDVAGCALGHVMLLNLNVMY
jgi:hypothetical protein